MFNKTLTLLIFFISYTSTAQATFHSWEINELFSNTDGSIQFIELFESKGDNDQHELLTDNAQLSSTDGVITHLMASFPNDLPSNQTANRFFLIATTGFATLDGAVTPDYILPDEFLFAGGGSVDFGLDVSLISHGALPTDGIFSLNAEGSTGTNSPTNFAGSTGSIAAPAVVPLPASVWLFTTGLLGLVAISRRRGS